MQVLHFTFSANVNSRSRSLSSPVLLSVVCRSVTFVRPTQAIEIFGNVSTPFGTLAIPHLSIKILRRFSQGTPPPGVKRKRGSQNIAILNLSMAVSRKRCKIGGKLLLISDRKSHMSFRLLRNSVTLDDLERHKSHNRSVISPNLVAFGRIM